MSSYVEVVDDHGNMQRVPVPPAGSAMNGDDRRQVAALSRSEAGRTASALATGHLMASFLGDGATSAGAAEKAAAVIDDLGNQLAAGEYAPAPLAPAPAVTRTESGVHVVQQPPQEEAAMPTDYELPAEYAFLNEAEEPEPDEDETEPEPAAVVPDALDLDEDDMLDPRIAALVAERDKLAKKAAHEQQLRVKTTRPTWEQEAQRVFRLGDVPLLDAEDLASIKADSKREFLRQAKQIADRNKRVIVRVAPAQRSEADIVRETKAQVWGPPPASAPPGDAETVDRDQRIARARRSGRLDRIFREMIS